MTRRPGQSGTGGFTLIELLVVIAILALLVGLLLPGLSGARRLAREAVCRSNIRQLHLANENYAAANLGRYVAAAPDILDGFGGRRRWHGVRAADSAHPDPEKNTFDPARGPLRDSLADGRVKQCPETVAFVRDGAKGAFEAGCGGYGYNAVGVGSRSYPLGYGREAMAAGMLAEDIAQPARTVMFTDTAHLQGYRDRYLIEYSFCEPPQYVLAGGRAGVRESGRTVPSIHFRHLGRAEVAWCDGHVDGQAMSFSSLEAEWLERYPIGWFGPEDNRLFDPN